MISNVPLVVCITALLSLLVVFLTIRKFRTNPDNLQSSDSNFINEQIYVGNLPYRVSENEIQRYFARFGSVEGVRIIRNLKTGQSKGYAFVTYNKAMHASEALSAHGKDFYGRSMVVRIAKAKQFSV